MTSDEIAKQKVKDLFRELGFSDVSDDEWKDSKHEDDDARGED